MRFFLTVKSTFLCCIVTSSLLESSWGRDPLHLINTNGHYQEKEKILNYLGNESENEEEILVNEKVLEIIDCSIDKKRDKSFVNKVFGTNFIGNANGIYLDVSNQCLVLYSSFDSIFSSQFCGSKSIEFFKNINGSICFVLKGQEVDSVLSGYDQLFRRILKNAIEKPIVVTFVVDMQDFSSGDMSEKLLAYLRQLLPQVHDSVRFSIE